MAKKPKSPAKRGRPAGPSKKPGAKPGRKPKGAKAAEQPAAAASAETVKPAEVMRMPSDKVLKDLHRTLTSLAEQAGEITGSSREKLGYAKEKHHLHTKAFSDVRKLLKMSPDRLNTYMAHFDFYADVLGLDKILESAPGLPLGDLPGEDADDADGADDEMPSQPHGEPQAATGTDGTAPNLGKPDTAVQDAPQQRRLQSIPGGLPN